MIDDLRALAIFAKVVEEGSFSAAGRSLKLSTSVVSHHISSLEEKLGVTLLYRSTRSLSLTEAGSRLLQDALRMVSAANDGLNAIADMSSEPAGTLRISAPDFLVSSSRESLIWKFARKYPHIHIDLVGTDAPVNLIADGFDIAIRLGELSDSTLKSRKLNTFDRALVASPQYLQNCPKIEHPRDLKHCEFVTAQMLQRSFELRKGEEVVTINPTHSRITVNSVHSAKAAILAGLGIQRLPIREIREDLAEGRLIEILPSWSLPILNVYAIWPASGPKNALVGLLVDFLLDV